MPNGNGVPREQEEVEETQLLNLKSPRAAETKLIRAANFHAHLPSTSTRQGPGVIQYLLLTKLTDFHVMACGSSLIVLFLCTSALTKGVQDVA